MPHQDPDQDQPFKKSMNEILLQIFYALIVDFVVGIIFSACKLPLPSPPVLAGVGGIVGIYLGGQAWQMISERFFS